ncbi:uncharacterized protein BHQ10_003608 [Talaromyces amestolkiae]|uniref:Glucose-methanol-choline oxidoreductase N-terminal domain-containing protein n=1 Tax=Talaromyces amestolkiae TaxID=1196081 RepID=A0A364KVL1_TALAM|nr:uncharacterized protein BHQ10_003608 [Talaromyces amestolkiae]RAO67596.1 hypothetical protein BHQ10_003608 [Talaromyces amestolkiae]
MSSKYDAIIVGGGIAGLVAAARLSEDGTKKILVVESGKDRRGDPYIDTPGLLIETWGNPVYDWCFWTTPQDALGGRQLPQPRGRVLGGSSAINATAMLYPCPRDFENWGILGNSGWGYSDLLPYYRKSTKFFPPSKETSDLLGLNAYYQPELYGKQGPIAQSFAESFGPFDTAFIEALDSTGLSKKSDPILGKQHGPFTPTSSVDPTIHKRSYAAEAYYSGMAEGRENVEVLFETHVDRLILRRPGMKNSLVDAEGVVTIDSDGNIKRIYGDTVILAAGSIQTPLVLERSGIGRRDVLEQHGIDVEIDSPGVGENLQDHVFASISIEVADGLTTKDAVRSPAVVAALVKEYNETESGPLASVPLNYAVLPPVDGSGNISTQKLEEIVKVHGQWNQAQTLAPGIQAQLSELTAMLLDKQICALYLGALAAQSVLNPEGKTSMADAHSPQRPENFLTISIGLNHPMSRGSVHIGGKAVETDVDIHGPTINPAYLSHPLDRELLARGLQFVRRLTQSDALKKVLKPGGVLLPPTAAQLSDLNIAKRVSRERAWSNYHPVGTCAMMPRELHGVVSDRLLVYGTSNIRVIDASVFPMILMGNIQATVYAVAEKACDLIKEDWLSNRREEF